MLRISARWKSNYPRNEKNMSDDNRRIHELFVELIDRPPSEWEAFLDANCDSSEVRTRLKELLNAHVRSTDFLDKNAMEEFPNLSFPFGGQIDEFQVIRLIGKGGSGYVYLAEDTVLKRLVALKIVGHGESNETETQEALERFRREARAVAKLDHPSVVKVYQTGDKGGLSYIAMEYIDGTTLREWIDSESIDLHSGQTNRCRSAAKLISQIADAIECAHRAGVIHRDIKPSNILIDRFGNARLADFGIAQISTEKTLHRPGVLLGSCAYMSPEQARILDVDIDHRTDIFSLGVVLYEAISRQRPFEGNSFNDVLRALADCRPKPVNKVAAKVPTDLATICHKAIEKNVNDRYQLAAHFSADLRCFLEGRPILACPPSYARRLRCWLQCHNRSVLASVVGILLIALGVLWFTYQASVKSQLGQLIVSDKHLGSNVKISRFLEDLELSDPTSIGTAPISVYLEPGLYRVSIESRNSILETSSLIDTGGIDKIEINPPSQETLSHLVEISSGTYKLGNEKSNFALMTSREVSLPAFLISPVEVTNREYREFVIATKAKPPFTWSTPYEEQIDDLPVTGITWDEANAYCRWRGVRLPNCNEWEAAAQGPDAGKFPWGNQRNNEIHRQEAEEMNNSVYQRFAKPVDSDPQFATPLGVKHMMSNVQEYTEGIAVDRNRSLVVKGRSWSDSPFISSSDMFTLSSRKLTAINRGFRIALSIYSER